MNRQQAKELLPIIEAFAEGKPIEKKAILEDESKWREVKLPTFNIDISNYRIKPEPKYRPFKDAKECWNEMQRHQPFGWVKHKVDNLYSFICKVDEYSCHFAINEYWAFDTIFKNDTFADGTPFGIKE